MSILKWKRLDHVASCLLTAGMALAVHGQTDLKLDALSPDSLQRLYGAAPLSSLWLEVQVNGAPMPRAAHLLRRSNGQLMASVEDLARWRIRTPAAESFPFKGIDYVALDGIEGLRYDVDEQRQLLKIDGEAQTFIPTFVRARAARYSMPGPVSPGAFLNYDLQYSRQETLTRLDGLLELGTFNALGLGTATFLGRDLDGSRKEMIRLDTAWVHDDTTSLRSLRLGDSVGRPGTWGRSVRFGGVQWGTDFSTRPDFVPFPLPGISGEALQPSTIDLYVDNALRYSQKVPYGPFSIANIPAITGAGQVSVVVRDLLGRETVVNLPYYVSNSLLREGLHDYTYEAGSIRRHYAVENNDYGPFFAAGTHRYGVADDLTAEARAELAEGRQTVGGGISWLLPRIGTLNAATAVSRSPLGTGSLLLVGMDHLARRFSFGAQTQVTSAEFAQLGLSGPNLPPRRISTGRATYSIRGGGSVFASYTKQDNRAQPDIEFVSAGYSLGISNNLFLSLYGFQSLSGEPIRSVGVSLTCSLGPRTSASVDWSRQGGEDTPSVQLQQSLPQGAGYGYRVRAAGGPRPRTDLALLAQNDIGTYGIEAARADGTTGTRVSASGGMSLLGGEVRLSRRLNDSFAVVKVGDFPNVPILLDNQLVGRTDGSGSAVIPALRPYQENNLSIQQDALPLDARVGALRMAVTLARRSAKVVEFPVHRSRGALLRILLEDGTPVPSGAVVTVDGQAEEFPVARRGEAYITDLSRENRLQVRWKGQTCALRVIMPDDGKPLPVLGPFICTGIAP
jgi:outer membrane usher protein